MGPLVGEADDGIVRLRGYLIREWLGDIVLVEHVALRWCEPAELLAVALPQSDAQLLRRAIEAGFVH